MSVPRTYTDKLGRDCMVDGITLTKCDVTPSYILPLTWRPDFLFKERGNGSPLMDVMWCVWCGEICEKTIYVPLTRPMPKGGGSTPHFDKTEYKMV